MISICTRFNLIYIIQPHANVGKITRSYFHSSHITSLNRIPSVAYLHWFMFRKVRMAVTNRGKSGLSCIRSRYENFIPIKHPVIWKLKIQSIYEHGIQKIAHRTEVYNSNIYSFDAEVVTVENKMYACTTMSMHLNTVIKMPFILWLCVRFRKENPVVDFDKSVLEHKNQFKILKLWKYEIPTVIGFTLKSGNLAARCTLRGFQKIQCSRIECVKYVCIHSLTHQLFDLPQVQNRIVHQKWTQVYQ